MDTVTKLSLVGLLGVSLAGCATASERLAKLEAEDAALCSRAPDYQQCRSRMLTYRQGMAAQEAQRQASIDASFQQISNNINQGTDRMMRVNDPVLQATRPPQPQSPAITHCESFGKPNRQAVVNDGCKFFREGIACFGSLSFLPFKSLDSFFAG